MSDEIEVTDVIETPESAAPDSSAHDQANSQGDGETASGETANPETGDKEPKKQYIPKPRFDEVYGKLRRTERELELERQIRHDLQTRSAQKQEETSADSNTTYNGQRKPRKEDFPVGDGYYDDDKYTDALLEFKIRQREAADAQAKADAEYEERRGKLQSQYSDYEEARQTAMDTLNSLQKTPSAVHIANAIYYHDKSGDLERYLGNNPAEIKRVASLRPDLALMELGELRRVARQESAKPEEVKEPPAQPVTKAPKPASPITKTATVTTKVDPRSPESDKLPTDQWMRERNLQTKGK